VALGRDTSADWLLSDVRVVDASSGLAGAFCAKHLVDAGAEVVRVEPPEGTPLRSWSVCGQASRGEDGPLFRFLAAGTRSVVGDMERVEALASEANVVIDDGPPGHLLRLRDSNPHLVLTTITPFGAHGPWAQRPATEYTLQGWCGSILSRGTPDRPPLQAGGRIGEWASGISAAAGTMAALRAARHGGTGEHVDVSMLEVMSIMLVLYPFLFGAFMGWPDRAAERAVETPGCERTADGWVGFCCNTAEQSAAFWTLVGLPELADVPELVRAASRALDRANVLPLFEDRLLSRTTADVLEHAVRLRIPAVPVGTSADLLSNEHLTAVGAYVDNPHGFRQPRVPYRIDDRPRRRPAPAPEAGQHDTTPWATRWSAPPAPSATRSRPLAGLQVLDLTTWLAGPIATHTFAGLGADVIKVESCQRFDNMRLAGTRRYSDDFWWEYAPLFHGVNAGKRDVTLDLTSPDGRRLARDLVARSDIVIENGTPRVLDHLGLGWDVVHRLNDQTIVVRMPAFGLTGPWRDRPGFAQSMEQLSGMAMLTGYPDGPPINPRGPCDAIQSMQAVIATLAALEARDRDGVASLVEVPMVETVLAVVAESQLEYEVFGVELTRMGNRSPVAAPQGLYPCRGNEQWLALAVTTNSQWAGLQRALGWADKPDLATVAARLVAHDAIDARIGAWAIDQQLGEAVDHLLAHGVPAAPAGDGRYLHFNEQLIARGFFEEVTHPFTGRYGAPGLPFRYGSVQRWFDQAAPTLGQHNREILTGLLDVSPSEYTRLQAEGVIGERVRRRQG
jgi:crotonobetainyl-CoA:carnitine CoA-transferase CaiB-like acyl-CoA transferase